MITLKDLQKKQFELTELYKNYLLSGDADFFDFEDTGEQSIPVTGYYNKIENWKCKESFMNAEFYFFRVIGLFKDDETIYLYGEDSFFIHSHTKFIDDILKDLTPEQQTQLCKRIIEQHE